MGVLKLKKDAALREKYRALLFDFPPITVQKAGEAQLETPEGKAKTIGQLIGNHSGELVELDRRHARWTLKRVAPGSASANVSERWYCQQVGAKAGQTNLDFGWPGDSLDFSLQLERDGCNSPAHDLMPNW